MCLSPLAAVIAWTSLNSSIAHVRVWGCWCGFWEHKLFSGAKIHEMHQKYIWRKCVGTAGKRLLRREMRDVRGEGGRWSPPHWARSHRQARSKEEKKKNSCPCKWHPERPVSPRKTLIPQLGQCDERLTPTYTVNGKVTFEKWGPHCDLIHWLTLRRGAFPHGKAGWFRLRLHFGLDLPPFLFHNVHMCTTCTNTHTEVHFISLSLWDRVGGRDEAPGRGLVSK